MRVLLALLAFLPNSSLAQVLVPPMDETETVKVQWDVGQRSYFPLPAGGSLSFATPGPIRLAVELRIRLPGGEPLAYSPPLEAQGDGHTFMTINAQTQAATDGHIFDGVGGVPSVASEAHLDVPAEGKTLSLVAAEDGPDFLIFLVKATDDDLPLTIPAADSSQDPWVESLTQASHEAFSEEPNSPEESPVTDGTADTTEPQMFEPSVAPDEPSTPEITSVDEPLEAADRGEEDGIGSARRFSFPLSTQLDQLEVGPRLGIGLPSWGTGGVPSLAARAYLPLVPDYGGVAVSLGWYRLKYDDRHVVVDPFLGAQEFNLSWRTHVVHLSAEAAVVLPWELGPVQPVAGAGADLYWARRVTVENTNGGLAPGLHVYGGSRFGLPLGSLEATIGWNGGRRSFSNQGANSLQVRESLASTHLDICWMMELP